MPPARLGQQHQLILANGYAYLTMQSMKLRSISTYAVLVHGAFELPTVETPLYAFSVIRDRRPTYRLLLVPYDDMFLRCGRREYAGRIYACSGMASRD
jgi:hypothetical protein